MKKGSKLLNVIATSAVILLCVAAFGAICYCNGLSKGYENGKMAAGMPTNATSDETQSTNMLQDILNYLTNPATNQTTANGRYTGPEAWMLNPTGKSPFWIERTDAEALALEVSENVSVEMRGDYSRTILSTETPLSADESFQVTLVVDEEITKEKLHEMNCYYPKHVAAGETAEIRIVLEEEDGTVYVGVARLTAGDEDLNLVHGAADPDAWYGAYRVDCDEFEGTFTTYFYTGATEAHWERPMFAGSSGFGGIVHCNYHCLEDDMI